MSWAPGPNVTSVGLFDLLETPGVHATAASTHTDLTVQTPPTVTHSVAVKDAPTDPTHRIEEVHNSFHDRPFRKGLLMRRLVPYIVLVRELLAEQFDRILPTLNEIVQGCDSCHSIKFIIN